MSRVTLGATARTTGGAVRLGRIEGLRALAAFIVLYYHLQRSVQFVHAGLLPASVVSWSERLGTFGVGIFFVLSGFLLYRPFASAALFGTARPRLGSYFVRRFARIYPAYWAALAFLLFVVGPNQLGSVLDGIVYFGLLQNYRTGSLLLGLGVAWTLVIEVSFYLVLPLLARLLRSSSASARRRLRRQVIGLAVMALIGPAVRVWAYWHRPTGLGRVGEFQPYLSPDAWLPGYLDWFALGMALAVTTVWFERSEASARVLRWFQARVWPAWIGALVLYRLVLFAHFPRPGTMVSPGTHMLVNTVLPVAAALVVAPVVLVPGGTGLGRRLLGTRVAVAAGTVSYGIYLWHLTVVRQVSIWIADRTLPRSASIEVVLVLALTAIAATASYVVVEAPMMRWSARVGRRRTPTAAVPADP